MEQKALMLDFLADIAIVFFVGVYFISYVFQGFYGSFYKNTKTGIDDFMYRMSKRIKDGAKKAWEKLKILKK